MKHLISGVDAPMLARRSAYQLGFAGLIPFWAIPVTVLLGSSFSEGTYLALLLWFAGYGAVIVSFMGGSRWVLSMAKPDTRDASLFGGFLGAVGPPLAAWLALIPAGLFVPFDPHPLMRLAIIGLLLAFQLLQDWSHAERGGVPPWYMDLRKALTFGAVTPIALAILIASF
ncbi:MAG: DUF3429 domain-containing protein [Parvularcula sp.]|nr:DUF3429 domain-containing protein [Parvularcula sp.]